MTPSSSRDGASGRTGGLQSWRPAWTRDATHAAGSWSVSVSTPRHLMRPARPVRHRRRPALAIPVSPPLRRGNRDLELADHSDDCGPLPFSVEGEFTASDQTGLVGRTG